MGKRLLKKEKPVTQCERCYAGNCRKQLQCSVLEIAAIIKGLVYECPDHEVSYWERLNAA